MRYKIELYEYVYVNDIRKKHDVICECGYSDWWVNDDESFVVCGNCGLVMGSVLQGVDEGLLISSPIDEAGTYIGHPLGK